MNKKAVYKRVVYFMNEYRKVWIYDKKHDHFLYGEMMGLIDALYVSGTIDILSFIELNNFVRKKLDLYYYQR